MLRESSEISFYKDFEGITEKSRTAYVSTRIEVDLARWLKWKLKGLIDARLIEPKVGSVGTRRGREMDLVVNLKRNKAGYFISILCLNPKMSRGFNCIYVPQGKLSRMGFILEGVGMDSI